MYIKKASKLEDVETIYKKQKIDKVGHVEMIEIIDKKTVGCGNKEKIQKIVIGSIPI